MAAILTIALAISAAALQAQIAGTVRGDDGRPLTGVLIELWNGPQFLSSKTTVADGVFELRDVPSGRDVDLAVTARKIGFRPASAVHPGSKLDLVLSALPQTLSQVLVKADGTHRDPCSRKPSTEAGAIFGRAAEYYRTDTRWLDRIARFDHKVTLVRRTEIEDYSSSDQRGEWVRSYGTTEITSQAYLGSTPMTYPLSYRDVRGVRGWLYPHLDSYLAPTFVMSGFVKSMPRSVVRQSAEGIVLSFCPSDRTPPYVSGEIELAADTSIIAIRWTFVVDNPKTDHGGIAFFQAPESRTQKAHLLPYASVTWERVLKSDYYERRDNTFGRWVVAERGDSIRGVPPREPPSPN